MTIITTDVVSTVAVDLYRDIHKGIRAELFALVQEAAAADPTSTLDQRSLSDHVGAVAELLRKHAEHEDTHIQTTLEAHLPELAERVLIDHSAIETRLEDIVGRAHALGDSRAARAEVHWLQLDLASFTADYLAHQDLEERQIMPALDEAVGADAVLGLHAEIIASIPPDELMRTLALMLPAMNVDDRTELLGGIRSGAPETVFDGIWDLTCSVLTPSQVDALAQQLDRS
ncbi:MAG: hemerythrin domain-containing protein [Microthrixaceae bacterium]